VKDTRDRSPDRAEPSDTSPDRAEPSHTSPDRGELSHALHDLSTVERWAERANGDAPAAPGAAQDPPEGPEFSVDTETVNGMHSVSRIAAHPGGVDAGPPALDESARAAVRSLVRSLLDLAGHESGPARTQVVLTAAGPRVVGCSLGR